MSITKIFTKFTVTKLHSWVPARNMLACTMAQSHCSVHTGVHEFMSVLLDTHTGAVTHVSGVGERQSHQKLQLSPDGVYLVASNLAEQTLYLICASNGMVLTTLQVKRAVTSICFATDSAHFAFVVDAGGSTAHVSLISIKAETWRFLGFVSVEGPDAQVHWSSDGAKLVIATEANGGLVQLYSFLSID